MRDYWSISIREHPSRQKQNATRCVIPFSHSTYRRCRHICSRKDRPDRDIWEACLNWPFGISTRSQRRIKTSDFRGTFTFFARRWNITAQYTRWIYLSGIAALDPTSIETGHRSFLFYWNSSWYFLNDVSWIFVIYLSYLHFYTLFISFFIKFLIIFKSVLFLPKAR